MRTNVNRKWNRNYSKDERRERDGIKLDERKYIKQMGNKGEGRYIVEGEWKKGNTIIRIYKKNKKKEIEGNPTRY